MARIGDGQVRLGEVYEIISDIVQTLPEMPDFGYCRERLPFSVTYLEYTTERFADQGKLNFLMVVRFHSFNTAQLPLKTMFSLKVVKNRLNKQLASLI